MTVPLAELPADTPTGDGVQTTSMTVSVPMHEFFKAEAVRLQHPMQRVITAYLVRACTPTALATVDLVPTQGVGTKTIAAGVPAKAWGLVTGTALRTNQSVGSLLRRLLVRTLPIQAFDDMPERGPSLPPDMRIVLASLHPAVHKALVDAGRPVGRQVREAIESELPSVTAVDIRAARKHPAVKPPGQKHAAVPLRVSGSTHTALFDKARAVDAPAALVVRYCVARHVLSRYTTTGATA